MAVDRTILDTVKTIANQTVVNEMKNFSSSMYSGIMNSLIGLDITQFPTFNLKNASVMRYHMLRNDVQKSVLQSGSTENAYSDGNPENDSMPVLDYTYAKPHSYRMFSSNIATKERNGYLKTSSREYSGAVHNDYFDFTEGMGKQESSPRTSSLASSSHALRETGDTIDSDSLLHKTKRLFNANKIKTIISQFHTKNIPQYSGQVGSVYGESHGRNLLKKSAELNINSDGYNINGYDNPYCRVWTHHYKYDRFSKTMRAKHIDGNTANSINYWGNEFEWDKNDAGHEVKGNNKEFVYGENYDYAWRGLHNQERRRKNSVLDESTGLVNIAPKYNKGGGDKNIHTKSCMFSIENLAWKDYDPYSFEQALSWEQRGPLGGRIMWFPPYNLKVTETNTAKWNQNDFIGRGESVYTYINSDRSGTLTFTMLVDHPSSIDYTSWHDNSGMHSDNDYHRYFAGCFGDPTTYSGSKETPILLDDNKTPRSQVLEGTNGGDNLLELPTYLTDEYTKQVPNLIKAREVIKEQKPDTNPSVIQEPEQPKYVEFYTFFPNNYSGYYDYPQVNGADVDAIVYLLRGVGAQKIDGYNDDVLTADTIISDNSVIRGYEMGLDGLRKGGEGNYIVGVESAEDGYVASKSKKWYYRIDCHLKENSKTLSYATDNLTTTNCISQTLLHESSYVDNKSYGLNSSTDEIKKHFGGDTENLYSFSDIACAMYHTDILNNNNIYDYLNKNCCNVENVNTLVNIFTKMKLTSIECSGTSNEHGANASDNVNRSRNTALAENRGKTVISWLKQFDKFKDVNISGTPQSGLEVSPEDKDNESGKTAKLNRNVHVKLTFTTIEVKSESQTDNTPKEPEVKLRPEDTAPVVGNDFNDRNWVKIYPGNIDVYLKDEYHYTGENNPDINDYKAVTWRENRTPIKWAVYRYENNGLSQVSVIFNKYIGNFNKDYQYKTGDICFYDNEFYASKYDFFNDKSDYSDENGKQLKMSRGNEYKEYYGFTYIGSKDVGDKKWDYYKKEPGMIYFEEDNSVRQNKNNQDERKDIELTTGQLKNLLNSGIIKPDNSKFDTSNQKYRGEFCTSRDEEYKEGDIVLKDSRYYKCLHDLNSTQPCHFFNKSEWIEIDKTNIVDCLSDSYTFYENEPIEGFCVNDITIIDGVLKRCIKKTSNGPNNDEWTEIPEMEFGNYNIGDYRTYLGDVYECVDDTDYYTGGFDNRNWEYISVSDFDESKSYKINDCVIIGGVNYILTEKAGGGYEYEWDDDLSDVFKRLLKTDDNQNGEFNGNYDYTKGDICFKNKKYWICDVDELESLDIEWNNSDWLEIKSYNEYDMLIIDKCAQLLCITSDEYKNDIGINGKEYAYSSKHDDDFVKMYSNYGCDIPDKQNSFNKLYADKNIINTNIDVYDTALSYTGSISDKEKKRLKDIYGDENVNNMSIYISVYNILKNVDYIVGEDGNRKPACKTEEQVKKLMNEKRIFNEDSTKYESDCSNIWIDRGDGLLIQECELKDGEDKSGIKSRADSLNKLRYDQEYHFYQQYFDDHPFVFQELREKIKYFNPAFHSMTPEGFNGRLTFLNQCTRQGATMTRSDALAGTTANNLAFGRPPFCVLRLGDFYHQMIVIESVNYNFDVSGELQWDLNTEGNGVQPMLCEVSISFKFIGGGDITGPVRRLQNAMSFNYYANTSFYDNRADRHEYENNYETMGGAGNNKVDTKNSYSYMPWLYSENDEVNITRF